MVPGRTICPGDRHFDHNPVRIHLHCCSGREEISIIMIAWNVKWFFKSWGLTDPELINLFLFPVDRHTYVTVWPKRNLPLLCLGHQFYVCSLWVIIFSRSLPSTLSSWWSWFQKLTGKPSLTSKPERALKNFSLSREFDNLIKKRSKLFSNMNNLAVLFLS